MNRIGYLKRFTVLFPLTFTIAVLALLLRASPASAVTPVNCLQDEYSKTATQKLKCTANDVRVAKVINVRDLNGKTLNSCNPGSPFSFIADFLVQTTSSSSRSNIGLYFATAGASQPTALTGQCSDNIIPPLPYTCPNATTVSAATTCQSSNYDELDGSSADNCGDSSSSDPTVCLDATGAVVTCPAGGGAPSGGSLFTGTQIVTVEIDNFNCTAPTGTKQLVLPNCTSWQVPGSVIQCNASPTTYPYPFTNTQPPLPEAIPGSPSKCNCATIPLPITVQSPDVSVSKSCTVPGQTAQTSCTMSDPGGSVTYNVTVTNDKSNFGTVTLDQICDDQYGTIATANGYAGTCPAGSIANSPTSTTCSLPQPIALNGNYPCSFTVNQGEASSVTNIAAAKGVGADGTTAFKDPSNSVNVSVDEALSTATTAKSLVATKSGCATVRYGVDVANTSSADETVSLTGLTDDAVDLTKTSSSILGTTCGVASGQGTLAGTTGAGTLPVTLAVGTGASSHYKCQFDAQFCGALDASGCISHTDTVVPALSDDDAEGNTVSNSGGSLKVTECFSATAQ